MTSRSDRTVPVFVYDNATAEPPSHRFFIDGEEVLKAFEESGDVIVRARSEAHFREIVAAFQILDQATFGGEH